MQAKEMAIFRIARPYWSKGAILAVGLGLTFLSATCARRERRVIVRILLPPSASPARDAIARLELSPLKNEAGQAIAPATMETRDDPEYRKFLQGVETYRPQVAIIPSTMDIPAVFEGAVRYATLPCSTAPNPCVAVIAPWASTDERKAAEVLLHSLR